MFITSGTTILFKPGIISGGSLSHDCPLTRSIGYYLEPIVMMAPFSKNPFHLTLRGITTDEQDLSVRFLSSIILLAINMPAGGFVQDCDATASPTIRSLGWS